MYFFIIKFNIISAIIKYFIYIKNFIKKYIFLFINFANIFLFYNSNKKKVIPNNIEELLTPLALAIWIMDYGTFKSPGLRIATNCFTKQEVELLVKALENKFNIKSSLQKKK